VERLLKCGSNLVQVAGENSLPPRNVSSKRLNAYGAMTLGDTT
jgi:hypothetical protein